MKNISQKTKDLKEIVNSLTKPVRLELLTQCGIVLQDEETYTDENLDCLKSHRVVQEGKQNE